MDLIFYIVFFGAAIIFGLKALYKEFMKSTEAGSKTSAPSSRQPTLYKDSLYRDRAATYISQKTADGKFVGKYVGGGVVTDVISSSQAKPKRKVYDTGQPMVIISSDAGCAHHHCGGDCHHG